MEKRDYLIFVPFVLFQIKHFLCDYPLQGKYMLNKFKPGWEFFFPLLSHCLVHAVGTYVIVLYIIGDHAFSAQMALLDLIVHFFMDRIKAGPKYLGRFKDMMDKKFWWCLGLDQKVHHLTHYFIIFLMFRYIMARV